MFRYLLAVLATLACASLQTALATPTVSISSPVASQKFGSPVDIVITANAAPSAGNTIDRVEFLRNNVVIGTVTGATTPHRFTWLNPAKSAHTLTAKAYDKTGSLFKVSNSVAITVQTNVLPTAGLSAPANGATIQPDTNVTLQASATDTDGTIAKVEYKTSGTLIGTATATPFAFDWINPPPASHVLTATSTDNSGGFKVSSSRTINVLGKPTVSITAPAANQIFTAPATTTITATAQGVGGPPTVTITKVDFAVNDVPLFTDNSAPYQAAWSNVPAGVYTLTAKATDNKLITSTATVNVTVAAANSPPTVSITSPATGSVAVAPATIPITVAASPTQAGASIAKIEIFNGENLLHTATNPASPYTYNWPVNNPGGYLLKAVATDSNNTPNTSAWAYAIVDGTDTCNAVPPLAAAESARLLAAVENASLTFEENRGQAHADVRFRLRGKGYELFLTGAESVLALRASDPKDRDVAIRMKFLGANPDVKVAGIDRVARITNYLIGRDRSAWRTHIPHFTKVRYSSLYPGIDEIFYANQGKVEYDLVVKPGADPRVIRLSLEGADDVALAAGGNLVLKTGSAVLVQRKPVAYQEIDGRRRAVDVRYRMLGRNEVGFALGAYDERHTLVIDPVLVYSTYLAGTNEASGATGIALSRCGEAFVAGWTFATDFPTTAGAFDRQSVAGTRMGYVAKLNPAGSALMYSTYVTGTTFRYGDGFETTQYTSVEDIAVDDSGHAYITGYSFSTDFPTTPGSWYPAPPWEDAGGAYIGKLNTDGSAFIYATYAEAGAGSIAVDPAGSAYTLGGRSVMKLNPTGSAKVYDFLVGGSGGPFGGQDYASAIAVDAGGSAYVVGSGGSNDLPVTPGAFQQTRPSGTSTSSSSGFVAKINPEGTGLVFGTYLGTAGPTTLTDVALDGQNNVYVTGFSNGSQIPGFTGTAPKFIRDSEGPTVVWALVAKLRADGSTLDYFSRLGGLVCPASTQSCPPASTSGTAIAVDAGSHAWIAGLTGSNRLPLVRPLFANPAAPDNRPDVFVMKLSPSGDSQVFSTILNGQTIGTSPPSGQTSTTASRIAVDSTGSAYITGSTDKLDFPTTSGAYQPIVPGNIVSNIFVTKLNENRDTATSLAAFPIPGVVGTATSLSATVTGNAPAGNVTFYDGTTLLGSAALGGSTAQLSVQLPAGVRALTASYAGDTGNAASTSTPALAYTVTDPNGMPTITLGGIADGTTLVVNDGNTYVGGVVTLTANAAPGNLLKKATLYHTTNAVSWDNLNAASWINNWALGSVSPGAYSMRATITDNQNHFVTSVPLRFVVNAAGTPPTATITAPASGLSVPGGTAISITANVTVASGAAISSVQFHAGSAQIGQAFSSPYTIQWADGAPGTYSVIAVAADNAQRHGMSAPITITRTAAPPPPLVSMTSPENNATLFAPADIVLAAGATPSAGVAITRVDFYNGASNIRSITTPPYAFTMFGMPVGTYTFKATAYDSAGSTTTSTPVHASVSAAPPPTVAITSPASGATFAAPASITMTADAATPSGTITGVIFYVNNTNMGSVNAAPYSLSVSNLAPGDYSIKASAMDSRGLTATSAVVPVTVSEAAPTVGITSPPTGRIYVAPASISITANAAASSGATITTVDFYSGTTLLSSATTPPYSYTWRNVPTGSYPLHVRATDSRGVTTESAGVFISVADPAVEPDGGLDGSTVSGESVLITGSYGAPPNSAVDINDVVATTTFDGRFFANDVPLAPGPNILTARLTTPDGFVTTRTLTVTRSGDAPFKVSADPAEGVAPLTVRYSAENPGNTSFATIEFDFNGDGTVDYTANSLAAATTTYIYPAGYFRAAITFKNTQGTVLYSTTKAIYVYSPLDQYNLVKGVYTGFVDRLKAGNSEGALNLMLGHSRAAYEEVFTRLGADLPTVAAQLGTILSITISDQSAELIVVRGEGATAKSFAIYLMRGEDGVWRIESM